MLKIVRDIIKLENIKDEDLNTVIDKAVEYFYSFRQEPYDMLLQGVLLSVRLNFMGQHYLERYNIEEKYEKWILYVKNN